MHAVTSSWEETSWSEMEGCS